ncbi:hypothetical protein Godav_016746 [Gossypium davidsonii]|uniref:Ribosomal protein L18ae family n=1 Tax=Gossypium davidsonii TaxID=34287 RepID=A0A7J8QSE0_GOSDV|nr:hypothetical protein [Gossypium davidsonii]
MLFDYVHSSSLKKGCLNPLSETFHHGVAVEESGSLRNSLEVTKSLSDKHLDLLRPSARYYSVFKGQAPDAVGKGKYTLIKDEEDFQTGIFDKPLPCFGCGIGWFSFLVGFMCPLMWYYATFLYFGNHYRKDPRERAGLAASAIAVSTPDHHLSLSPLS